MPLIPHRVLFRRCGIQMEHDRQMALREEAEKVVARKKLSEVQRGALHVQMQERETLKREVRRSGRVFAAVWLPSSLSRNLVGASCVGCVSLTRSTTPLYPVDTLIIEKYCRG